METTSDTNYTNMGDNDNGNAKASTSGWKGINRVAFWNQFQGGNYMILGIFFMIYPQFFDLFAGKNEDLSAADYKSVQYASSVLFAIGYIFIDMGSPIESIFVKIQIKLIGQEYGSRIKGAPQRFAVGSIVTRLIIVPVMQIIVIFTFGQGNVAITTLSTLICIADPILAILTIVVLKKWGKDGL